MTSLKTTLTWSLVLSLVLLLTFQFLIVSYAISRLTENQLVDRLQRECETLLSITNFNSSKQIHIDTQHLGAIYLRPFSGHYFSIQSEQQQLVSRSLWDSELNVGLLKAGEDKKLKLYGPEKQPLLVVLRGFKKQDKTITIAVAENIEPLNANINRFQITYAFISFVGLLLMLLVQRLMILNALKPLQQVQKNIVKLAQGKSSQLDAEGPVEIMPLIEDLNRLLTGLDRKYHRSRESLGNLAHALKTRLTLLNQIAERKEIISVKEAQSSIYELTAAMNSIVERELKRARLLGNLRPGRQVDLKVVVTELINTLRQIYSQKGINITWEILSEAKFLGDKEDLIEMLGNLLDNACKWSIKRVSLTITGENGIIFIIEDDGIGPPVPDLEILTKRGFRADESQPGSGLGLAIVNDIVESYNGNLSFSRSPALGGLRVEVKLG